MGTEIEEPVEIPKSVYIKTTAAQKAREWAKWLIMAGGVITAIKTIPVVIDASYAFIHMVPTLITVSAKTDSMYIGATPYQRQEHLLLVATSENATASKEWQTYRISHMDSVFRAAPVIKELQQELYNLNKSGRIGEVLPRFAQP